MSVGASADLLPIPQPNLGTLNRVTRHRLAPDSARVDLLLPPFSNSTGVTNPLFPIAALDAVILGEVEGVPLKIETTLLPDTKVVTWHGRRIEALQSQFCAYLKGRITELELRKVLSALSEGGFIKEFTNPNVGGDYGSATIPPVPPSRRR